MPEREFLSIGEVLALLLDEFPDVTISKIRFLESKGLIDPERTSAGYRRFTEGEVERLRFILREQRQNYLPLSVIRDRLGDDTDLSAEFPAPTGEITTSAHPAARGGGPRPVAPGVPVAQGPTAAIAGSPTFDSPLETIIPQLHDHEQRRIAREHSDRTESIPRDDLLRLLAINPELLKDLEHAGLVSGHDVGDTTFFDADSIEAAKIAARFSELGVDVRHLRTWKGAVDREMSLYEQRILPMLRQRNPGARETALAMLEELVELGEHMRAALIAREFARIREQK
jgi:DNA-binding transcriptional MerR regulator